MGERTRHNFPVELRANVKQEQRYRCADCGRHCGGVHPLTIHHVVPQSMGGSSERANAVGLCPKCHERHDAEAFCNGRLFYETLMEEGRWYDASRIAKGAGIPASLLESPSGLRSHLSRETAPYIVQRPTGDYAPSQNMVYFDGAGEDEWGNVGNTGKRLRRR